MSRPSGCARPISRRTRGPDRSQISLRIDEGAVSPDAEMQMAAGAPSGRADAADHLTRLDPGSDTDRVAAGMEVVGDQVLSCDDAVVDAEAISTS